MFQKTFRLSIIIISAFLFFCGSVYGQKINKKALTDSTRINAKRYKLEAKQSLDSFRKARKFRLDSIRKKNDPDTIPFRKSYRAGIDISKPITSIFSKEQKEVEFSLDYHIKHRFFLAAEAGYQHSSISSSAFYKYSSNGEYLKLGFDYNIFIVEKRNDNDVVYLGVRAAAANVSYHASNIIVQDTLFGNSNVVLPAASSRAYWLEFLFGLKVEISKRVFMGWALRLDASLNNLTTKSTYPIFIPGYGLSSDTQNINYSYSIYYSF